MLMEGGDLKQLFEEEFQRTVKDFTNIKAALMRKYPFIAAYLRKLKVVAEVAPGFIAATDGSEIALNPLVLNRVSNDAKKLIILHEAMHVALGHPERAKTFNIEDKRTYNIAADSVIHEFIDRLGLLKTTVIRVDTRDLPPGARLFIGPEEIQIVTLDIVSRLTGVPKEFLQKKSTEEIYKILLDKAKEQTQQVQVMIDIEESQEQESNGGQKHKQGSSCKGQGSSGGQGKKDEDEKGKSGKGRQVVFRREIQQGDPSIYDSKKNSREIAKELQKEFARSIMAGKLAGTLPGDIEDLIAANRKAMINWNTIIRNYVISSRGLVALPTWARLNRKFGNRAPGYIKMSPPTVYFFVDVSMSMSREELEQILSEAYEAARSLGSEIVIIQWSVGTTHVIRPKSPEDLKKVEVKGRGGTVLAPALKFAKERLGLKLGDILVIASDFEIADKKEAENTLEELARITGTVPLLFNTRGYVLKQGTQFRF